MTQITTATSLVPLHPDQSELHIHRLHVLGKQRLLVLAEAPLESHPAKIEALGPSETLSLGLDILRLGIASMWRQTKRRLQS